MKKFFKCKNPGARIVEKHYDDGMLVRYSEGCSVEDQRACHSSIVECPLSLALSGGPTRGHGAVMELEEMELKEIFDRLRSEGIIKYHSDDGIADVGLRSNFGAEYADLSDIERELILQDFLEAEAEDHIGIKTYYKRIGKGNLISYARVMVARLRNGWE